MQSHESQTYPLRLLEFRDCLKTGFLFPQWCTHFRQGFGSPYFGYYQPGFFYAASVLPEELRLVDRVAVTSFAFAWLGYLFTYLAVGRRFGVVAGLVAATAFALSEYGWTNLCVRGDLSEFAAMNLVPAVLYFLDGFLVDRRCRQFSGLVTTSGLLIIMHSCISLVTFAYLAAFLVCALTARRLRTPAILALAALFLGAGLAAFYWLPVLLEWDLIAVKNAFSGFYHYRNHFVEPIHLVFTSSTVVSTSIGLTSLGLMGFSVANLVVLRKQIGPEQRPLIAMAGGLFLFAMFLMSSISAFAWQYLPLLYRLQFPFRLLALLTIGMAFLIGCIPQWKGTTLRSLALICFTAILTYLVAFESKREIRFMPFIEPAAASDLEQTHFGPDCEDEWLPRGAIINRTKLYPRDVIESDGARASEYQQSQGRLTCRVTTARPSFLDLPHFYFPGWTATLNESPLTILPNDQGRIRVELPAACSGELNVQFSMTPMRRLGIFISVTSSLVLLGISLIPLWNRTAAPI